MIVDFLLDFILDLVEWVVQGIPSGDPLTAGITFSFISDLNYFLPITEMFTLFMSVFLLGGPLAIVSLVIWVLVGVIRGGSTKA